MVAEHFSVDVHVAHTYFLTNFDGRQYGDYCQRSYNNIVLELTRALNFFRFSNPDSHLSAAARWRSLCGKPSPKDEICKSTPSQT
ncbi:MAG: hypothetical protein IJK52_09985 [Oscillospiraceae bacterium]|nr:hypothetical protein [Oscillospiraceae bacterium]